MLTKAEAKRLAHLLTVRSLRKHKAKALFPDIKKETDLSKLDAAMTELAEFLEKRGKINEVESSEADAGGESKPDEAEVPSDGEPQA